MAILFFGILGFIYSEFMVPPLVEIKVRYCGWRAAFDNTLMMHVRNVEPRTALLFQWRQTGSVGTDRRVFPHLPRETKRGKGLHHAGLHSNGPSDML